VNADLKMLALEKIRSGALVIPIANDMLVSSSPSPPAPKIIFKATTRLHIRFTTSELLSVLTVSFSQNFSLAFFIREVDALPVLSMRSTKLRQ